MRYHPKGVGSNPPKSDRERFLDTADVQRILDTVRDAELPTDTRDHCAIFLGYHFGLRVTEATLLNRDCFRDIDREIVYVRRLKQIDRIPWQCTNPECGKRTRVSAKRIGTTHACSHCGTEHRIVTNKKVVKEPPEKILPAVEGYVLDYVRDYLKGMRSDQTWLFESHPGKRIGDRHLRRIFGHYVVLSGLDPRYSWHALRHGRGVVLWDLTHDQKMVQEMLGQKSMSATTRYIHLSPAKKRELKTQLESVQIR